MKNKYLVIAPDGAEFEPNEFIRRGDCPSEFRILVEREALGLPPAHSGKKEANNQYLKFAEKLGFSWEPLAGQGFIRYDENAWLIMRLVMDYSRKLVNELEMPIKEVRGSNFFKLSHPSVEAYAALFGERLFQIGSECSVGSENEQKRNPCEPMVMGYDASFPQFGLAAEMDLREEDLPFAHFSISDCYRYEQSGECMLLFRGRRFFMPDLHPYFANLDQAFMWYPRLEEKIEEAAHEGKREYWNVAKVSSIRNWELYKQEVVKLASRRERPVLVEIRRDGEERYWILDVDYSIIDAYSQVREIGCIQIDVGNAERLGISYKASDGSIKHPVIIHSAIPGGLERYLYMLFDNFKEGFPYWLYPVQKRFIPVSEKFLGKAKEYANEAKRADLRVDIDSRAESVSKRIKRAYIDLIPDYMVIGERES